MNAAELVATSLIIEAHAYDPEMLACKCGVSCLPPHHAMHVALQLQGGDRTRRIEDLRAALTAPPEDVECCASGRCEVCTPGYVWGNDR